MKNDLLLVLTLAGLFVVGFSYPHKSDRLDVAKKENKVVSAFVYRDCDPAKALSLVWGTTTLVSGKCGK